MRIIKHGNKFEIGETTCPTCHCIFAYAREDISSTYNRDEGYDEYYVNCPECIQHIFIPAKEVEI